jgi:hypothetical protein
MPPDEAAPPAGPDLKNLVALIVRQVLARHGLDGTPREELRRAEGGSGAAGEPGRRASSASIRITKVANVKKGDCSGGTGACAALLITSRRHLTASASARATLARKARNSPPGSVRPRAIHRLKVA